MKVNFNTINYINPQKKCIERKPFNSNKSQSFNALSSLAVFSNNSIYPIAFSGKNIAGVVYSKSALKLGDKMISPQLAKSLSIDNKNKIDEINALKVNHNYTNANTGVVNASTVIAENDEKYTACNVDFFSSRTGVPAGIIASSKAIASLNNTIKVLAITNEYNEIETIRMLANKGNNGASRADKNFQIVIAEKNKNGKPIIKVKTLKDYKILVPSDNNSFPEKRVKATKSLEISRKPAINEIEFSPSAQKIIVGLETKYGKDKKTLINEIFEINQKFLNKSDDKLISTDFNNAPTSNVYFVSTVLADNGKHYTSTNVEFNNNNIKNESICSERLAVANAINDGANNVSLLFLNNNHQQGDNPCGVCIDWLSGKRAGGDLLVARFVRDENKFKTDKVIVNALSDLAPMNYRTSKYK